MTGLTLELERIIQAPSAVVYRAFADPDVLAQWWGPQGFTAPRVDFRPRVGDSYRIEMQPPEGDPFHLTGEFRDLEPPTRLAFTFAWEPPDPDDVETLVELAFRDRGDSTELALTQGPFGTEERRKLHRDGWSDSFDKLEALVGGR
jgi:uncharacterized protein YndB with AHSA1/START domain